MTDEKKTEETPVSEAVSKADAFRATLHELVVKCGEVRALVIMAATLFAAASPEERAKLSKDEETRKSVGAAHALISLFTSQHYTAVVLQPYIQIVLKESPLRGPETLADAMADGMTMAAMTCTCGACVPCKLKAERGLERATKEMHQKLRATVGVNQMAQAAMTGRGRA